MNCPKCNQPVEAGAAFCGNCGQALMVPAPWPPVASSAPPAEPLPAAVSPVAPVAQNQPVAAAPVPLQPADVPAYAVAQPAQHIDENKAIMSLIFGIVGIIGALFLALLGLAFGIAGLVTGTMSRSGTKRGLSTAGLVTSSLAILVGLAVWVYAINHDPALHKTPTAVTHSTTTPAVSLSSLNTPCYSAGFVDKLNVSHASGSCDMSAFNGPTLQSSSNAYKVYADQSTSATATNFTSLVKPAIEKDVKDNLPTFAIDNEQVGKFAGSPAYLVNSSDKASGVAVVEAAVLHKVSNGDNIFILVHAANGKTTDLSTIEAQWQWK